MWALGHRVRVCALRLGEPIHILLGEGARPAVTTMSIEHEKRLAAELAAELVEPGMTIGLGSGSTVAFLLPALARRKLSLSCVASSPRTEQLARDMGLRVQSFERVDRLDLVIDGADQIAPDGWLVKGGGAAHTREKILAAAGDRFVVIADSRKPVPRLHGPVPLELLPFGLPATLRRLQSTTLRGVPRSPDGGIIADYRGSCDDPAALAAWLDAIPGLVAHGLFPASLVSEAFVARGNSVERIVFGPRSRGAPSGPSGVPGGFRPAGDGET